MSTALRIIDSASATARPPGATLAPEYRAVRSTTEALCAPLAPEDYVAQSMPDASPAKWHLAHTSWFFERFVLQEQLPGYRCFHPAYDYLFNSYYQGVGPQSPRQSRGLLTRPGVEEIYRYRHHVDRQLGELLERGVSAAAAAVITIGLHHEQQHQELLLTDLKHLLSCNPLQPAYRTAASKPTASVGRAGSPLRWRPVEAGVRHIGAGSDARFCFDNETPRHPCHIGRFALATRPVSNAEYREFVLDGGYRRAALWLSDGWPLAQGWQRPLYWSTALDSHFTLEGEQPLEPDAPVCHLSYYEADAFARWSEARLPTEQEWECVAASEPLSGNFLDSGQLGPRAAPANQEPTGAQAMQQLFGDVWEWTASAYLPYPGFRPWPGTLGEYNGKFMANQFVLRGGSCATPASHLRATYRNFFYPHSRWQFSGLRLAKDL